MKIHCNGEEIFYRRCGRGKPFVLVHGNMSSSLFFERTMKTLEGFDFLAPDMRGFGNSSYRRQSSDIGDYVEDLRQWILQLKLENFHLLGWSFGGGVVMKLLEDPQLASKVDEVIFLSSMGTLGVTMTKRDSTYFQFLRPLHEMSLYDLQKSEKFLKDMSVFPWTKKTLQPVWLSKYFKAFGKEEMRKKLIDKVFQKTLYQQGLPPTKEYRQNLQEAGKQRNFYPVNRIIGRFAQDISQLPSKEYHVLHGGKDAIIEWKVGEDLAQKIHGSFQLFPHCGHSIMTDDFQGFCQYLNQLRRTL